ncbi:molybdopterin biosynthesis protein [Aliigemmobacter aestuarii]|uniref:Molybdopterin biosynthesis protein n=1 Tax=Aliigemmobacter aestuarii TaxID=1445661 RepID=A0A4S3MQY3_9RHOB|nr:molybdopterin-binding protein [Gemmobacter aestuarii]THD84433.1 molybdopterin biosynthesis protein [Gemmobacter aestuarii]
MRFGAVPLDQAEGAILAHSVAGLRKGKRLTDGDVAILRAAGRGEVIVARLDPEDRHEDEAATVIANALVPDPAAQGLRLSAAATGRVNLHAMRPGVCVIDAGAIHALNRVNPLITLATVAPFARMAEGDMVATVKIIAYGVPAADVDQAARAARGAMRLAPPACREATLIETTVTGEDPPPKGRKALADRLARLGIGLSARVIVPHRAPELAAALAAAPGEALFILTASATSDPADVGPAALVAAGGTVTRFGMPVDPGNLLFHGDLGGRPVIGLPGCARSPALNGADWVMERILCGLTVTADDIARMGVGGLLKDIPQRGRMREA